MNALAHRRSLQFSEGIYEHSDGCHEEDKMTHEVIREGYKDYFAGETSSSFVDMHDIQNIISYVDNLLQQNTFSLSELEQNGPNSNKTEFWLVSPRTIRATEQYFTDLASHHLSTEKHMKNFKRKIPIFNKIDELFLALYDNEVPIAYSLWFLKITKATQASKDQIKSMEKSYLEYAEIITTIIEKCYTSSNRLYIIYLLNIINGLCDECLLTKYEYFTILLQLIAIEGLLMKDWFVQKLLTLISFQLRSIIENFSQSKFFAQFILRLLSIYTKKLKKLIKLNKDREPSYSIIEVCCLILLKFYAQLPQICDFESDFGISTEKVFSVIDKLFGSKQKNELNIVKQKAIKTIARQRVLTEFSKQIDLPKHFILTYLNILSKMLNKYKENEMFCKQISQMVTNLFTQLSGSPSKFVYFEFLVQIQLRWTLDSTQTKFDLARCAISAFVLGNMTQTKVINDMFKNSNGLIMKIMRNFRIENESISNFNILLELFIENGLMSLNEIVLCPEFSNAIGNYVLARQEPQEFWYLVSDSSKKNKFINKRHEPLITNIKTGTENGIIGVMQYLKLFKIKDIFDYEELFKVLKLYSHEYSLQKFLMKKISKVILEAGQPLNFISATWQIVLIEKIVPFLANDDSCEICTLLSNRAFEIIGMFAIDSSICHRSEKLKKPAKKPKIEFENLFCSDLVEFVSNINCQTLKTELISLLSLKRLNAEEKEKWKKFVLKTINSDASELAFIAIISYVTSILIIIRQISLKEVLSSYIMQELVSLIEEESFQAKTVAIINKFCILMCFMLNLPCTERKPCLKHFESDSTALQCELENLSVYPAVALLKILSVFCSKLTTSSSDKIMNVYNHLASQKWLKDAIISCETKLYHKSLLNDPFIRQVDAIKIVFNIFSLKYREQEKVPAQIIRQVSNKNLTNLNDLYLLVEFLEDIHTSQTSFLSTLTTLYLKSTFDKKCLTNGLKSLEFLPMIVSKLGFGYPANQFFRNNYTTFDVMKLLDENILSEKEIKYELIWLKNILKSNKNSTYHFLLKNLKYLHKTNFTELSQTIFKQMLYIGQFDFLKNILNFESSKNQCFSNSTVSNISKFLLESTLIRSGDMVCFYDANSTGDTFEDSSTEMFNSLLQSSRHTVPSKIIGKVVKTIVSLSNSQVKIRTPKLSEGFYKAYDDDCSNFSSNNTMFSLLNDESINDIKHYDTYLSYDQFLFMVQYELLIPVSVQPKNKTTNHVVNDSNFKQHLLNHKPISNNHFNNNLINSQNQQIMKHIPTIRLDPQTPASKMYSFLNAQQNGIQHQQIVQNGQFINNSTTATLIQTSQGQINSNQYPLSHQYFQQYFPQ